MNIKPENITGAVALEIRKAKGLNQAEFWGPLGVTQSGGSRYESDRNIPEPVQRLADLIHLPEKQSSALLGEMRGKESGRS